METMVKLVNTYFINSDSPLLSILKISDLHYTIKSFNWKLMNEIFVLMIYKFHYLQMGYFDNMFSLISATKTMIRLLEN